MTIQKTMFLPTAFTILWFATKWYPMVNSIMVWNVVQSVYGDVNFIVDELLAPQAKIQLKMFQILTNHTISIPFRIIGGMVWLIGGSFRRGQIETITRVGVFNIKKIGDAYTVFTPPEFNVLFLGLSIKLLFFIVINLLDYFFNKWASDRFNDYIEQMVFQNDKKDNNNKKELK